MSSVSGWQDLQRGISNVTGLAASVFTADDYEYIQGGLRCFKALVVAKANYNFLCCHINRSELHHVLLSSSASQQLRAHRIPSSLAHRRPLLVHQRVLPSGEYSRIEQQIGDFFRALADDHNIDIQDVEDPRRSFHLPSEDVFEAARKVWSHVLMETMDAYILAAAIESEADCLITSDELFRKTVNNLRQGQGNWQSVSQALRAALNKRGSFSFPQGISVRQSLP